MRFAFIDRMLESLGGNKAKGKKRRKAGHEPKRTSGAAVAYAPAPETADEPDDLLEAILGLIAKSEDAHLIPAHPFDVSSSPSEELAPEPPPEVPSSAAAVEPLMEPEPLPHELLTLIQAGEVEPIERYVQALVASARGLQLVAQDKLKVFAAYELQLERAIGQRDFLTLAFLGSNLIVDAYVLRDDLLAQSKIVTELADKLLSLPPKKMPPVGEELVETVTAFQEGVEKKRKLIETLDARLLKAHQSKDYATLSDIAGGLARDALILLSLFGNSAMATSQQQGLTASTSSEKAAQLDQQVAQLHQAVLDRRFSAISDLARILSLSTGVLADPTTGKATQLLQMGQQLQQALRSSPDNPGNAALCTNMAKISNVFNGPLMDKASQLEGQVSQLLTALKAVDTNKLFALSVTIARSASILTDGTVQKASLLAGYVPRIEISLKRKDPDGAASALKSALS